MGPTDVQPLWNALATKPTASATELPMSPMTSFGDVWSGVGKDGLNATDEVLAEQSAGAPPASEDGEASPSSANLDDPLPVPASDRLPQTGTASDGSDKMLEGKMTEMPVMVGSQWVTPVPATHVRSIDPAPDGTRFSTITQTAPPAAASGNSDVQAIAASVPGPHQDDLSAGPEQILRPRADDTTPTLERSKGHDVVQNTIGRPADLGRRAERIAPSHGSNPTVSTNGPVSSPALVDADAPDAGQSRVPVQVRGEGSGATPLMTGDMAAVRPSSAFSPMDQDVRRMVDASEGSKDVHLSPKSTRSLEDQPTSIVQNSGRQTQKATTAKEHAPLPLSQPKMSSAAPMQELRPFKANDIVPELQDVGLVHLRDVNGRAVAPAPHISLQRQATVPAALHSPVPWVMSDEASKAVDNPVQRSLFGTEPIGPQSSHGVSPNVTVAPTALPRALAPHVAQQIATALAQGGVETTQISLNPEELGRVRISLSTSETGLTVSILAERPETADLMRRNMDSLLKEFAELGYDNPSFTFDGRQNSSGQAGDNAETGRPDDPLELTAKTEPPRPKAHIGGLNLTL